MRGSFAGTGVAPLPRSLADLDVYLKLPSELFQRTFVSSEVADEPALALLKERFAQAGTRSLIAVPIRIDGELRGLIVVATLRESRAWDAEEVAFVEGVVRQLSGALRQAELASQVQQERDRLEVLFALVTAIHRCTSVSQLIEATLKVTRENLKFPIGILGLVGPEGHQIEAAGAYGRAVENGMPLPPLSLTREDLPSLPSLALESDEPIFIHDLEVDPRAARSRERLLSMGVRTVAVFALRSSGKKLGVLMVGSSGESRKIEADDILTLKSLAGFVSIALEQRRTAEDAERSIREAHALSEASRALLTRTANRDLLLHQLLDALVLHFGQENCRLLLLTPEKDHLFDWARRGDWSGMQGPAVMAIAGPGLTAAAARSRQVVNVGDVRTDSRYVVGWPSAQSELVVPLRIDDEVVGAFDIQSTRLGAFSVSDVRLLTAFADRAALAIRLADLVGQLEGRTRVLESVARATKLLNFRLQTPDVLSSFVEETSRAFPNADGCIAYVAQDDQKSFVIAAAYGLGKATQAGEGSGPIPMETFRCAGRAYLENRPVLLETAGLDDLMSDYPAGTRARVKSAVENAEIRHLMAAPIRVGDRRLGVIEVLSCRPRAFTAADAETLVVLADHAAIALRNARMVEELQRSNRLKDDFLANLSHEVRTPLTGIVGWAEVLLDARGEDAETRRALEAILGQADTLSRMLTDLIDLSRIDNFGLEIRRTRVKLTETIAAALDAVSPSATKRGISLVCDAPNSVPSIEGDPGRLKQVVWNLLANSIKFSPPGTAVQILLDRSDQGGVELVVSDSGSGIDPAFLPFVFERFRQEETSANRRFGGLGVGLAIARAIVEAHGGAIDVESAGRGKGSLFRVRFPASRLADQSSGATRRLEAPVSRERSESECDVLVIDEDPVHRDHLVRLCESLGALVMGVADEEEARQIAESAAPGVLFVSAPVSGQSGSGIPLWARRPGFESLRFVALVESDSSEERKRLLAAGFEEVVVRPARRAAVEKAIGKSMIDPRSEPGRE